MSGFFLSTPWIVFSVVVFGLVVWGHGRLISLVENFLKVSAGLLGTTVSLKKTSALFLCQQEVRGTYKGREVVIGIERTGLRGEFLLVPRIQVRLRDALGYNLNRLPHYATVEKKMVVYKIKLNVLWSVFDKNYVLVFGQSYLIVALERLLATAEDLERGRLAKEMNP